MSNDIQQTPMQISDQLYTKLKEAEYIVAFTGAGISAESGIPTFRGDDGIWKKMKPEELASFDAFMRNTELVWEWYKHRKHIIKTVEPNAGHRALAEMETLYKSRRDGFLHVTVITQNIDNLHRRAGSTDVLELHGNIERSYCVSCGKYFTDAQLSVHDTVPRCTSCNGLIRPDVVWFGEMLPDEEWKASVEAAERADILFAIGTSGVVYPAASLPVVAKRSGAYIVEINTEPSDMHTSADEVLLGQSGKILPEIVNICRTQRR